MEALFRRYGFWAAVPVTVATGVMAVATIVVAVLWERRSSRPAAAQAEDSRADARRR